MAALTRILAAASAHVAVLWLGVGLGLAAGCGARPDTWPPAGTPGLPLASTEHGGAHVVALVPLGGVQVPLMVDTGIRTNVISSALAWYLSLPREKTDLHLVDSTSTEVPLLQVSGGLALASLGRPELYAAFLPRLDASGLAGMLSPQSLVSAKDAVVVDLARGELGRVPAEAVLPGAPLRAEACASPSGVLYFVAAQVEGHAARLLVDTGTPTTAIDSASPLARALKEARLPHQDEIDLRIAEHEHPLPSVISGGVISSERVNVIPGVAVRVGGVTEKLDVQLSGQGGDRDCPSDGTLGLDFLRGFTLVLTRSELLGRLGTGRLPKLVDPAPLPAVELSGIDVDGACPAAMPNLGADSGPVRYADARAGWAEASARLQQMGTKIAAACQEAGYARSEVTLDLVLAKDRRTMRGKVTVWSGPRYRFGKVELGTRDGTPPPALAIDRPRPGDFYQPARLGDDQAELERRLAPLGLRVIGRQTDFHAAAERVDLEFIIGR